MKIKRIVFPEQGQVAVDTVDADLTANPGEVVIRTLYTCVSVGTELAKLTGDQEVDYPHVPGNRGIGEVIEVGEGVTRAKPGDVVFGYFNHVSHTKDRRFVVPVPPGIEPLYHASTAGMALVAMTALRQAAPELGDWAVVFGAGTVGNFCAQLMGLQGAEVIAVDLSPQRLDVARQCGVPYVLRAGKDDVVERVLRLTQGRGAEIVVEATGNPRVFETACDVAKRGGDVILLGSPRLDMECNLTPVLQKVHLWRDHGSLTLKGAHEWRYPLFEDSWTRHSIERNARIIFRCMQRHKLHVVPLISHVLSPEEAPPAFDGLLTDRDSWVGVVFDWTND